MIAMEEKNAENSSIHHVNSNSGEMVQKLQDEQFMTKGSEENVNGSQKNNDQASVTSVFLNSSSSSSQNEVGQEFITRKFNHYWDDTFEDGTPLGIAKANNHIDIMEYLIGISSRS